MPRRQSDDKGSTAASSNQQFGGAAGKTGGQTSGIGQTDNEGTSSLGGAARQASRQARSAAGSLASQANEQVRMAADRQVAVGADLVAEVAESVRTAADSLDQNVPQLAQLARGAADRIEDLSEAIRDQSAADLFQATSDFARRRPAAIFGAAAVGGFLLFRLLSVAQTDRDYDDFDEDDWDDDWDDWEEDGDQPALATGGNQTPGAAAAGQPITGTSALGQPQGGTSSLGQPQGGTGLNRPGGTTGAAAPRSEGGLP